MARKIVYIRPAHREVTALPIWGSIPQGCGLVRAPDPPVGLDREERERVERLARQAVKRGWRRRAEDYPTPLWVARSKRRQEYYLARLKFELTLREGYK